MFKQMNGNFFDSWWLPTAVFFSMSVAGVAADAMHGPLWAIMVPTGAVLFTCVHRAGQSLCAETLELWRKTGDTLRIFKIEGWQR